VTGRSFTLLLLSNTFFGISSKVLTHVYRVACRSCSFRYVRFRDECKPHPNTPAHTYLTNTHTQKEFLRNTQFIIHTTQSASPS
jgi:hypothetical protein